MESELNLVETYIDSFQPVIMIWLEISYAKYLNMNEGGPYMRQDFNHRQENSISVLTITTITSRTIIAGYLLLVAYQKVSRIWRTGTSKKWLSYLLQSLNIFFLIYL